MSELAPHHGGHRYGMKQLRHHYPMYTVAQKRPTFGLL